MVAEGTHLPRLLFASGSSSVQHSLNVLCHTICIPKSRVYWIVDTGHAEHGAATRIYHASIAFAIKISSFWTELFKT